MKKAEDKRIIGLDLLRVLSMMGIIGLHVINNGGLIKNADIHSFSYYVVLAILVLAFTSVNIFGILSGYLNVTKKQNKHERIIELLLIVLFYCLIIPSIFFGFNLFDVRNTSSIKEIIYDYFPILAGNYWYITCYVFLFFMIPYINSFVNSLAKKTYKKLLITLFVLLSILPNILLTDLFRIQGGYSPFWLIYCYMIGGYLRIYDIDLPNDKILKYSILIYFVSFALNGLVRNIGYSILGKVVRANLFINYISPFTLVLSILIFIYFTKVCVKNSCSKNIIVYLSGASFSVYIIHDQRLVFYKVLKNLFKPLLQYNAIIVFVGIILSIVTIYVLCCIIDSVRKLLFKLLKINKFIVFSGTKVDKILN